MFFFKLSLKVKAIRTRLLTILFFVSKKKYYGYLIGLLGVILFSTKAILAKVAYSFDADFLSLLFLRMLYSLPVYLFFLFQERRKRKVEKNTIQKKDFLSILFLGIIGYYLSSLFDFRGLEKIDASLERLILFTYPTFTLLFSFLVFKIKPSRKQLYAIIFTYFGVILLFGESFYSSNWSTDTFIGIGEILTSSVLYGAYLALASLQIKKMGSKKFTIYVMLVSCIVFIIHFIAVNQTVLLSVAQEVYVIGFFMAVFSTVLPSFLITYSISLIGANNTAIVGSVGPISTILLAYFILGERLGVFEIFGGGVIFLSILYLTQNKRT